MKTSSFLSAYSRLLILVLLSLRLSAETTAPRPREADIVLNVEGSGPRPYVALWIENKDAKLVRTLKVWGNKPKYQRELRAWKTAGGISADGLSGATRPNGAYRVHWDGLGEDGLPLPPGEYILHAESVREEGERSHVRVSIPKDADPVAATSPGDGDIASMELKMLPSDTRQP